MKKSTRRILTISLLAVLLVSMSVFASADGEFVDGDAWEIFTIGSANYTAHVHTDGEVYTDRIFDGAEPYYHTFGVEDSAGFFGTYSETVTFAHTTTSGSDFYISYVHAAGEDLQLYASFTTSGELTQNEQWHYIDPASPSGNYAVGVRFQGNYGTWQVSSGIVLQSIEDLQPAALPLPLYTGSGSITFAPTGTYYIAAYPCD